MHFKVCCPERTSDFVVFGFEKDEYTDNYEYGGDYTYDEEGVEEEETRPWILCLIRRCRAVNSGLNKKEAEEA